MHEAWKAKLEELKAVPKERRDNAWALEYWEATIATAHEDCQQPQCSCHFPPGYNLTTGQIDQKDGAP